MKQRKLTKEDKAWIIGMLIVAALLFAAPRAFSATYTHAFTWRDPDGIYDSLLYRIKVGNTVRDSSRVALADSANTSVTLDQDSTYVEEVFVWYTGATMWSSPSTTILSRWTGGTVSFSLTGTGDNAVVVYTTSGSDTLANVRYTVSTGGDSYWSQTGHPLDTFGLNDGTWQFILTKPGYLAVVEDSAITANDTLHFEMSQDGTLLLSPSNPALASVYGWLIDISGQPIVGASVNVTRKGSVQNTDTTASKNIISNVIDPVLTDTLGRFSFNLIRSNYYKKAVDGVYEISATRGGAKIFDAIKITVPATGNLNLGDTLAARL